MVSRLELMTVVKLALGALCVAALVSGCTHKPKSTPTEIACAGIDWWEAGRTDGVAGHSIFKLDDHKRRCGEAVDSDLYLNGRDAGLIDFCTPQQAFSSGRAGLPYENVCPANVEPDFLRSYQLGARLHALESQDLDLEARITHLTRLLGEQQGGSAVRAQLEQLRSRRAELISEMSKLEKASGPSTLQ